MLVSLVNQIEENFGQLIMHSRLSTLKNKVLNLEDKSMPSIACYLENGKEEADAAVDSRTRRALTLFDGLQQCYSDLTGHLQVNAAQLEVSVRAWQASARELPPHWLTENPEVSSSAQAAVFERFNCIVDFLLSRPDVLGGGTRKPFSEKFLQEREKLKTDPDYLFAILGPYGQFKIPESKSSFEHAVRRAKALDEYVLRLSQELESTERGLNGKFVDESDILKAKKQSERAHQKLQSLNSSIDSVSLVVTRDLSELEKATTQFRTLSWCIDGLAGQFDRITARLEYLFKEIEEINVETEALRPWRGKGADEATWNNFTTVFKEMDVQLLEKVQNLNIFATSFSDIKIVHKTKRRGTSGSSFSVASVWSTSKPV